jgi:hypothetical protein
MMIEVENYLTKKQSFWQ